MVSDNETDLYVRKRLRWLFAVVTLLLLALIVKLGWIQLVMAEELRQKAWDQWNRRVNIYSTRGNIYDRKGALLAGNTTVETVVAVPAQIDDAYFTARALSQVLDIEEERVFNLVTMDKDAVYVKRKITEEEAMEVRLLNLPGITFANETKRLYPNGSLLSQVLGYVGTDQGWGGLEIYYEDELRGQDGSIVIPTDNRNREIPGPRQSFSPREGMDLVLTIDETIQFIVERELSQAMSEYSPRRIIAIAVNPKTGEILAAASLPSFDPNFYNEYSKDSLRLFPVTDTFEPGSTFKLITLSAVVEEDLFDEEEQFFCSGAVNIAGFSINCWTAPSGGHGAINYLEAVEGSCNPAFIKLGERLGTEKLFEYIKAFGFGVRSGIDYPGEGTGLVFQTKDVGRLELATTSFGQGISVTPLQQVMAVSAIANGGYLMEPYLVKEVRDAENNLVEQRSPKVVRQVISGDTAKRVSLIMEKVVSEGSAINAYLDGYRVAGKTGTAQKVGSGGEYLTGDYLLSFIGFVPVDDPEILLYIAVDGARRGPQWGSQVGAPIFKDIIKDVLAYLEIPPAGLLEEDVRMVRVPDLKGLSVTEAAALLDEHDLFIKQVGDKGVIIEQTPKAEISVPLQSSVLVYLEDIFNSAQDGELLMPDLVGTTVKEAGEILGELGLVMDPVGSGIAASQQFPAGAGIRPGTTVKVYFFSPLHNSGQLSAASDQ